ncbi:MAG: hypothetical protein L3J74_17365 [Bacteroidales bacterium]|nr:hypothetical protein [Bacteroidales bacterium]
MEENFIYLFGFKFMQPGAFITDQLIAIVTFIFYLQLKKHKETTDYSYFFLFMSITSMVGGFGHLLYEYAGLPLQMFGWIFNAFSIYFIEKAVINELSEGKLKSFFSKAINLQVVLYLISIFVFRHFIVLTINSAIGMLALVVPVLAVQTFKKEGKNFLLIIIGILLSGAPALLHKTSIGFSIFSAKEISHLILILCFYLIFMGINRQFVPKTALVSEKF